ncbi:hypothetical protein PHJA_002831200 [Phtheirospermum japonicum]|uniref:Bifunctional inhibitor/plant lipid transfer protein/seed storage helical domain-containing protein n=1 Tax=Phtheirospermum japonicum TaxID=374723 RepID=A0A830C433_9LAMI|nr:hypothetical protein PHJA_001333900 [Phtheirospermum japonicum]GFQ06872.1 hypothetical protein PHJA_002831200 [Phtheirospermum japonicum]
MIYLTLFYASIAVFTINTMVSAQCQGNFQGLVQQCSRYVQKPGPRETPSQGCCNVVKNVDLACVCGHITSEVEQIVSMEKAAYVAAFCGKPIPHGTRCGSKITSPANSQICV